MPNLNTIQQDIAELTPEAQQIVIDFIEILKRRYSTKPTQEQIIIDKIRELSAFQKQEVLDFIDFMCSRNYKPNDN